MNTPLLIALALVIPVVLIVGLLTGARFVDALNARPKLWKMAVYSCAVLEGVLALFLWSRGERWWGHAVAALMWACVGLMSHESSAA